MNQQQDLGNNGQSQGPMSSNASSSSSMNNVGPGVSTPAPPTSSGSTDESK